MKLHTAIAVALGGALGAVIRYALGVIMSEVGIKTGFPWSTFMANILGCFAIGLLFYAFIENQSVWWTPFIIVGLLGGFTTFSSFGLESVNLWQNRQYYLLACYLLGSNILGLGAVVLGMKLSGWRYV